MSKKDERTESFTLDYAQMNRLFELLDPIFHGADGRELENAGNWKPLRALRNQLYRCLD